MKMKRLLVFGLAVMFMFCAGNAFALDKDGPGYYTHTATDAVKWFDSHPPTPSQWVFLSAGNCVSASAHDYGIGYASGLGFYDYNNNSLVEICSYNSNVEASAFAETIVDFEGDGFVMDLVPCGGDSASAFSEGSVDAWTLVKASGQIIDFPYYGCDYDYYDIPGGMVFESYNIFKGSGNYDLSASINMMVEQYNGALAEVGSGFDSTWASGSNSSGGSIDAFQAANGTINATQHIGWGATFTWIDTFPGYTVDSYAIDRVNGDIAFIGMEGFIDGDGYTEADAYRSRDDNFAISKASALTESWSTADLSHFGNVPYWVDVDISAFGSGGVTHYTNAILPDGSAMAGTSGNAGYSYEGNGYMHAEGSGIAQTYGISTIERDNGTFSVHSISQSSASSRASSGCNGYDVP